MKEMYTYVENNFAFYKHQGAVWWKNCIRHNLSMKKEIFIRHPDAGGVGVHLWSLVPGLTVDDTFPRRRLRVPKTSPSLQSSAMRQPAGRSYDKGGQRGGGKSVSEIPVKLDRRSPKPVDQSNLDVLLAAAASNS